MAIWDDSVDESDETFTFTLSSPGTGSLLSESASATTTITDDDTRGVTLSATTLAVDEGSTGTYTVVLDSEPTGSVTVTVGGATGDVSASPTSLTFTTTSWSTAQTVTVAAAADDDAVADTAVALTHALTGADYASETAGSVTVTVTEDDDAPLTKVTNLQLSPGDGSLSVSWAAASVAPNGYSVRWREQAAHPRTLTARNEVSGTAFTISGLTNGTLYFVRVDTYNAAGDGIERGTKVSTTGTPVAGPSLSYPTPPTALTVGARITPLAATASHFTGGARIVYTVSPDLPAGLTLDSATGAIAGAPSTASPNAVTVTVTATAGSETATAALTFPAVGKATLAQPTGLAPKPDSKTKTGFAVLWNAVTNAASYTAKAVAGTTTVDGEVSGSGATREATFTGLAVNTEYAVSVVAKGDANYADSTAATLGVSTAANQTPSITDITGRTATFGTNLLVDVDATDADAGDTLQYKAASSDANVATVSPTAPTSHGGGSRVTVTPVGAGTATITVTVNDGTVDATETFIVAVSRAALGKPTVTVTAQDAKLTATWANVANAAGYEVQYKESDEATWQDSSVDPSPADITGLTNGEEYDVRVRAKAAAGSTTHVDGAWSDIGKGTPEATPPTKVTNLQVSPLDGSLSVSWTAASVAPNGYSVRWRERGPGNALSPVNDVDGTSFTIPDLTNGTTYVVRVETRNAADDGVQDGTVVTETGTPRLSLAAPVVVLTGLAERIEVNWDAVDHAEEYELGYREQPAQATDEWPVDESKRWVGPERTLALRNLEPGQVYEVRVRALPASDGAYSPSPWSEVQSSAALAPPLQATAQLDALPTVGAAVALTGSASGGQEPYGYAWTVTGEPEGSAVTLTGAETAGPSFTPTHVGTYTLRVTVTDGAGTTATAEVSAEAGHPGAATGLAARSGNGALAVSWTAAARAPHGYRVRWRARGPTGLNEGVVVRGTSRRIESLANGTTYVVRVDTVNATNDGLASGTRVTTTGTPRASGSASAGLPTVGVHDAQGDEGDALAFRITLSQAAGHTVTVRWRTEAGTAQAGEDFASAQGSETFEPGETARTVEVQTLDDAHDDPGETFRVLLTDVQGAVVGDGEAVGTIRNRDALPEAWLAHFGRAVAEQALDGVAQRLAADRTQGTQGTLAGAPIGDGGAWSEERTGSLFSDAPTALGDWSEEGLSLGGERTMTVAEALAASHFTLTGERDEAGASVALWGRGAQSRFDARAGATDLDGTLMTGLLGADYGGEDWLGGVALAWSDGEGGYREPGAGSGELEASLGAVIPYASLKASERLGLWGAAGYGAGTMTLTPEGGTATQADLDWSMVAAGLRGELLAPRGASGLTLALVSDALWAQTDSARVEAVGSGSSLAGSESEVTRLRLGLEGRWAVSLEAGGSVAPRVEAGVRHDGGDAGSGVGVELGGGVTWEVPRLGLSLDLAGRTLLAHESDGRRERGLSATVGYDARPGSERGLSLTLRQETGGRAEGGLDALLAPEPLDGGLGAAEVPSRWTAEAAYGLPVFGGRLTASPTVGVGLSGPAHDYSLGWRLAPAASPSGFSVGVKATRRQSDDTAPAHGIELKVGARW